MKFKQKVDTIVALILIFMGTVILILPLFDINQVKIILITNLILYAIIKLGQFIITKNSKDYEGLYTSLASIATIVISFFLKLGSSAHNLAITLFIWIVFMSIIKLKKSDYYHDRRDRMWKLNVCKLSLFILIGLLTCINLYYEPVVQIVVLGFFFLIHGILELFDPVVKTLISHS